MQKENRGSHCKPLQQKLTYLDGVKPAFPGMDAAQLLNQGGPKTNNCEWVTVDIVPFAGEKALVLRTTRYVYPGEELYVSYGKKFWSEQLADPNEAPAVVFPTSERSGVNSSRNTHPGATATVVVASSAVPADVPELMSEKSHPIQHQLDKMSSTADVLENTPPTVNGG